MERREPGEPNNEEQPHLLDVVKIDGRWAQVRMGGGVVLILSTNKEQLIDWNNYRLVKKYKGSVGNLIESQGEIFTDQEINNIRWGDEQVQFPHLKKVVRAFGEYVKK